MENQPFYVPHLNGVCKVVAIKCPISRHKQKLIPYKHSLDLLANSRKPGSYFPNPKKKKNVIHKDLSSIILGYLKIEI